MNLGAAVIELIDELESMHSLGLEELEEEYPHEFALLWKGEIDSIDEYALEDIHERLQSLVDSSSRFRSAAAGQDVYSALARLG